MNNSTTTHPTRWSSSAAARRVRESSLRPASLATPESVIALSVGEPDQPTPDLIRAALDAAVRDGYTRYPHGAGDPELREALAEQANGESAASIGADNLFITHGGAAGITATMLAAVDPGDRVIIPAPTYSLYQDAVHLAGGEPVYVPNAPDGTPDLERIAEHLPTAKLLVLCSPGNPTGAVITRSQYEALADLLAASPASVLVDEAYSDLTYDDSFCPASSVPGLADRLIVCRTFSKSYAMTGWRLGWIVAPRRALGDIALVHRTFNGGMNAAVQRAGIAAVRARRDLVPGMRRRYRDRRDLMHRLLAGVPGLSWSRPAGAFYFFCRYDQDIPSTELTRQVRTAGVAVRPGLEYGPQGEGHIRLSFATSEELIIEGIARLGRFFEQLSA